MGVRLMVGSAVLAEALAAAAPAWATLAPHRAVYDISLISARPGAGISELTGRMVYELTGSQCQGFTQNMRFVTRTTNQEGKVSVTDLRSNSWEDAASDRFRFTSSQYRNDELADQTAGEATRRRGNGEIRVDITKPKRKVAKIPVDTMFPVQHSAKLLEAARGGATVFAADLFDASERAEKVYATNAFIGARLAPGYNKGLPGVSSAERLDELNAWPVALSYYERGKDHEDAVPSYELAFVFFENGVSRRIRIDYGDFAIRGELKSITFLEEAKCEPNQRK